MTHGYNINSEEIYEAIVFKEITIIIEESRSHDLLFESPPIQMFGGANCEALGTRYEVDKLMSSSKLIQNLWNEFKFLQLMR